MRYQCVRCSSQAKDVGLLCAKHARTPTIEAKPRRYGAEKNKAFYATRRWKYLRLQVLSQQPLCACCELYGRVEPAIDVDHIWPISHSPSLSTSISNMQALCHSCHSRKTSMEQKGAVHDYRRNRQIIIETGEVTPLHVQNS